MDSLPVPPSTDQGEGLREIGDVGGGALRTFLSDTIHRLQSLEKQIGSDQQELGNSNQFAGLQVDQVVQDSPQTIVSSGKHGMKPQQLHAAVLVGDIIYLTDDSGPPTQGGIMCGDLAHKRFGVQAQGLQVFETDVSRVNAGSRFRMRSMSNLNSTNRLLSDTNTPRSQTSQSGVNGGDSGLGGTASPSWDALNFEDYAFRVTPMLKFGQKNELETLKSKLKAARSRAGRGSDSDDRNDPRVRELEARVLHDDEDNLATLRNLEKGMYKEKVKYGREIQLQHVKSGLFLTVKDEAASQDPDCRAVALSPPTAASVFRLMPRYKAQSSGSVVHLHDSCKLECFRHTNSFLHNSPVVYDEISQVDNEDIPACLRRGRAFETNISLRPSYFKLSLYARYSTEDVEHLRSAEHFRLFHSQLDAFIHASCNAEKNEHTPTARDGGIPAHIPYLRRIGAHNGVADPHDPQHQSTKGIWSVEAENRSEGSVVAWNAPIRIRHVPSGKYLSVTIPDSYRNGTVSLSDEFLGVTLVDDDDSNESRSNTASRQDMLFRLAPAETPDGKAIPLGDISIVVEHHLTHANGSTEVLYLSGSRSPKPKLASKALLAEDDGDDGIFERSLRLELTDRKNVQDILKLMVVPRDESELLYRLKSYLAPLKAYTEVLRLPSRPPLPAYLPSLCRMLNEIIDLTIRGTIKYPSIDTMIQADPTTMANLFKGDQDVRAQNMACDVKLLDALVELAEAPYQRVASASKETRPFELEELRKSTPEVIQKLVHVCLQRVLFKNRRIQDYYGRKSTVGDSPQLWMNLLLNQIEDPLGSSITLSRILSSNERLMRQYATEELIQRFLSLVQDLGPDRRFLVFFGSICVGAGEPDKKNQELVLRLLWNSEENRHKTLVDLRCLPSKLAQEDLQAPQRNRQVSLSQTHIERKKKVGVIPASFVGKDNPQIMFGDLQISWNGSDSWEQHSGALYWSPASLGLKVEEEVNGQQWVSLIDLCKVLETEPSEPPDDIVERKRKLSNFLVGQLRLLADLCYGRSYNVIHTLSESFGYPLLVNLCSNTDLPDEVRAAACTFIRALYVDRFPQLSNCGRSTLPEQLWVAEALSGEDPEDLPLIRNLQLKEDGSLPAFRIGPDHHFAKDPDELYSFPSHSKFFLLRQLSNKFLQGTFPTDREETGIVHQNRSQNALTSAVLGLVENLVRFGFMSQHAKIHELVQALCPVLDGRKDRMDASTPPDASWALSERFRLSSFSPEVTSVRIKIINILMRVSDLRAQFRLSQLLNEFKEMVKHDKHRDALLKFHETRSAQFLEDDDGDDDVVDDDDDDGDEEDGQDFPLSGLQLQPRGNGRRTGLAKLFSTFERLFTGDGMALDLNVLAGAVNMSGRTTHPERDVVDMLIDCLMYEDDDLFSCSLELLERTYGQRKKLLQSLDQVVLLPTSQIPVFGSVNKLMTDLGYLMYLARSAEVWGIHSSVSPSMSGNTCEEAVEICENLLAFLQAPSSHTTTTAAAAEANNKSVENDDDDEGGDSVEGAEASSSSSTGMHRKPSNLSQFTTGNSMTFNWNKHHQDILRCLNLHEILREILRLDANTSFETTSAGDRDEEACQRSFDLIVDFQRGAVKIMKGFVIGNEENQALVFQFLPLLEKHFGQLRACNDAKVAAGTKGLETEMVVLECLRGNKRLCEERVSRDLVGKFARLVSTEPDISTSHLWDFFTIICLPDGEETAMATANPRNQGHCASIFMSDSMVVAPIKDTIMGLFHVGEEEDDGVRKQQQASQQPCARPDRVMDVLCRIIMSKNEMTAGTLQAGKITIDATIEAIERLLPTDQSQGQLLHSDDSDALERHARRISKSTLLLRLVEFLSLQMEVLVMDPQLFHDPSMWAFLCTVVRPLLHSAHRRLAGLRPSAERTVLACVSIVVALVGGARDLGHHGERQYARQVSQGDCSVLRSLESVALTRASVSRLLKKEAADAAMLLGSIVIDEDEAAKSYHRGSVHDSIYRQLNTNGRVHETVKLLHYFGEALTSNPKLKRVVKKRKFELVSRLKQGCVQGVDVEDDDEDDDLGEGTNKDSASVASSNDTDQLFGLAALVTGQTQVEEEPKAPAGPQWQDIVRRMVHFVKAHNFDEDESHCIRIFRILQSYLEQARSDESGEFIDEDEMKGEVMDAYKERQELLSDLGVSHVVTRAIATHAANREGSIADMGIELLMELSRYGTPSVQNQVYRYIMKEDRDLKFLHHFNDRLKKTNSIVAERKAQTHNGFIKLSKVQAEIIEDCVETYQALQALCEGHHADMQDIFREQPMHTSEVNLLAMMLDQLVAQCETSSMLLSMQDEELELLSACLEAIIETMQGPCIENQELVVQRHGAVEAIEKILGSDFDSRNAPQLILHVKSLAIRLFDSALEGRQDEVVHEKLAKDLPAKTLDDMRKYLVRVLGEVKTGEEFETRTFVHRFVEQIWPESSDDGDLSAAIEEEERQKKDPYAAMTEDELDEFRQDAIDAMVSLNSVSQHLMPVEPIGSELKRIHEERLLDRKGDKMDDIVATIEVSWNDRIAPVSFQKPVDWRFLKEDTKQRFLDQVDLETVDKRMRSLLDEAPDMIEEMEQIYSLAKQSPVYRFIDQHIKSVKGLQYALVILLNLNIIMVSYGENPSKKYGYESAVSGLTDANGYGQSVAITWILGIINLLGYVVIVLFIGFTEVPLVIRQTDARAEEMKDHYPKRDIWAFKWWGVTLVFNIMFILMYTTNYKRANWELFYFLIFGINMPWTLLCLRNWIVVPNTTPTRLFSIVFDIAITKGFFRNHVLLMACSLTGFFRSPFFTLMLLDCLNNSKLLQDIIRSVTVPAPKLALVFFVFIITVMIYAQFGVEYFEDWFVYDGDADDAEAVGCHSVVSCFFLIFYLGIPSGSIGDVMDPIDNRGKQENEFLLRVLYDMSFFIWVGILLFNIITGLMVDQFSALREESEAREDTLSNECFVCGFKRENYDELELENLPPFDEHKEVDHNLWNYVYYVAYLNRRPTSEYNGVESYVSQMIQNRNLLWLPLRDSFAIQSQSEAEEAEEDDSTKQLNVIQAQVLRMGKQLESLQEAVLERE